MQLCMNMLDLTWDGTSKCFLRSSVIFIDILGFPRTFFPRTFSPCVFSQVSFFTSTSHNETVINKKVSQNWAKYSSRHIQIACCFSTSYDLIQKWSCRVFFVVVVISWFLSSKMRFFYFFFACFQDRVDILIWRNGFGGLGYYQVSHIFSPSCK